MQRILELAVLAITKAGHVRHTSDLLLEKRHQPLKRSFERNTRSPTEYVLMQDAGNAWKYDIARIHNDSTSNTTDVLSQDRALSN